MINNSRHRLLLLVALALLSSGLTLWLWIEHGEVIWLALLGTVPLLKKLLAWQSVLSLAKKLPWLLVAGLKKYLIKVLGTVGSVKIGLQFPWVQRLIDRLRELAGRSLHALRDQWSGLNLLEKTLVCLFSFTLAALIICVLLLSKSLQLLTLRKGSEAGAEQLVKRSVPNALHRKIERYTSKTEESREDTS